MINKYNQSFKISDDILLYFNYPGTTNNFYQINQDLVGLPSIERYVHYYHVSDDITRIVFDKGNDTFKHRQNIDSSGNPILSTNSGNASMYQFEVFVYLHQGFNWDGVKYIHLLVKPTHDSNVILANILLDTNDFRIDSTKRFKNQHGWTDCVRVCMPKFGEEFMMSVNKVGFDDISTKSANYGYLYNYPQELSPLSFSKPFPDFIRTKLEFDENQFLKISTYTTEQKTLEASIRDYFDVKDGDIENINIDYNINYSFINKQNGMMEGVGYQVANGLNNFQPIKIGLDLNRFIDWNNPTNNEFEIAVTTNIYCNGKRASRYARITTNFSSIVIARQVKQPTSISTTNIEEKTEITQSVITEPVKTKIVKIIQPLHTLVVSKDINYESANISIAEVTIPSYMVIDGIGTINSQSTADDKIYFDMTLVDRPEKNTPFKIYDNKTQKLIHSGVIKVS